MEAKLICLSFLIVLVATFSGCSDDGSTDLDTSINDDKTAPVPTPTPTPAPTPAPTEAGTGSSGSSSSGSSGGSTRKILCLHGGGGSSTSLQYQGGMADLEQALSSYDFEFVYAQAPDGGLWMRDPPGGKGQATTDPDWSSDSISILDQLVQTQGPFFGILGYSQGSAFIPVYLSSSTVNTFQVAMMFCGYLPTTHQGLLARINAETPWNDIPALVFMGQQDSTITNAMTEEQAGKFTSPVTISSSAAGHALPTSSDSTFQQVVSFLANA